MGNSCGASRRGSTETPDSPRSPGLSTLARKMSALPADARPDVYRSIKLGLDPRLVVTEQYEFGEVLGKGYFGCVYEATQRASGKKYAVKTLSTFNLNLSNLKAEITILQE